MGLFELFGGPSIETLKARHDVDGLIRALEKARKPQQRRAIADALVALGPDVAARLTPLLRHSEAHVQDAALRALERLLPASEFAQHAREAEEQREIEARIARHIATLRNSTDGFVQDAAIGALRAIGTPTVDAMLELLSGRDPKMRHASVRVLQHVADPRAVEPLMNALKRDDSYTRRSVLNALWANRDRRAIELILACLTDADLFVRECAAEVLGRFEAAEAVEPLARLLARAGEVETVKEAAAEALGRIRDSRGVEALLGGLALPEVRIQRKCIEALGRIGDARAVPALISKAESGSLEAAEALGQIGDARATGVLTKLLTDEFWNMRRTAALALGRIGAPGSVRAILALCGDEDDRVLQEIPVAMRLMGTAAVTPLIGALADRNAKVRETAAHLVCELEPDVRDPHRQAQLAVAVGKWSEAGALGDVAVPALLIALRDADPDIRRGAATGLALARWQPINNDQQIAWAIARRAWHEAVAVGPDAIDALAEAAIDWSHHDVRTGAILALKALGPAAETAQARAADEAARRTADRLTAIYRANPRGFTPDEPLAAVREIACIGQALNDLGEMSAMRASHAVFASQCRDIPGAGRNLEIMWHGIGRWQG